MKKIEIEYKKIEDLIPYENNPRKNDEATEYVANSIKEFGFKVPIVIDKNNVIVAGHTRLKAAKKLNIKEVPCIMADDLTEEQVKAFRIADNSTAETSLWDWDKLDVELEGLDGFDMDAFGIKDFDAFELLDEAGFDVDTEESSIFHISLNIPKDYETAVKNYIRDNGKDKLTSLVIKECGGE